MELQLTRTPHPTATTGDLTINGLHECFTLEDVDRGLLQSMSLSEIQHLKVYSKTAIPKGRYEIAITFSNKFQKYMPLLLNVPGFEGIRIHQGNTAIDTDGCILVGQQLDGATIKGGTSRPAFNALFPKLQTALKKEKIWITIS